jgi:hypothetical protein
MENKLKADLAKTAHRAHRKLAGRPGRTARAGRKPVTMSAWPPQARELVAEVQRALKAWNASAEGQAFRSTAREQGLDGVKQQLGALLTGPVFARTRDLAATVSLGDLPFPLKSISIGAAAAVEFIIGVYGSIGYAVNFADLTNLDSLIQNSVIYYYEALSEGVDAGADIAVQAGFWNKTTDEMGGYYWGVEIEADDLGGLAGFGLATDEDGFDLAAVLIDVTAGIADGVEGLEFWAQTHKITNPVAQPTANHMMLLTNLHCSKINSISGHDEVNLTFVADGGKVTYRYPTWNYYAMSEDQSAPESNWAVGRSIWFNNSVQVKAWDGKDNIASFTITYDNISSGQPYVARYDRKGSISNGWNEVAYELTAQIVNLNQ